MKSVTFFNGQETQARDFNEAQQYLADAIKDRLKDVRTPGILEVSPDYIIVKADSAKTQLQIYGFTAYDSDNERIYIPVTYGDESGSNSDSMDTTNGVIVPTITNLGMDPDDEPYDKHLSKTGGLFDPGLWTLVVRHINLPTGPVEHHVISGEPHTTVSEDSYEFICRSGGNSQQLGDVVLAELTVDGDHKISIDESVRTYSTIIENLISVETDIEPGTDGYGGTVLLTDHINAFGHGKVSKTNPHGLAPQDIGINVGDLEKHQALCHVDGIRSDDINSTLSALYPSYHRETSSNEEFVYIRGLSSALNEMVVANGFIVSASDFPNTFTYAFESKAAENYKGYYLFALHVSSNNEKLNPIEISVLGPYESESDAGFQGYLSSRDYFPICSCKWGQIGYDYNQDEVIDKLSYDIIPGSFKDRRIFNNTSLKNFRPDEAFALSQFAPICNDTAYLHNARVVSATTQTEYDVVGKTLTMKIDGGSDSEDGNGFTIAVTFVSGNQYLQVEEIADQLNTAFAVVKDGIPAIAAYAVVTESGALSISAPISIDLVQSASNDARALLGFTSAANNLYNADDVIKELIYMGDRNGIVYFTYDDQFNVTRIDYLFGGGVRRYNLFVYNGDMITAVKEIVEPL